MIRYSICVLFTLFLIPVTNAMPLATFNIAAEGMVFEPPEAIGGYEAFGTVKLPAPDGECGFAFPTPTPCTGFIELDMTLDVSLSDQFGNNFDSTHNFTEGDLDGIAWAFVSNSQTELAWLLFNAEGGGNDFHFEWQARPFMSASDLVKDGYILFDGTANVSPAPVPSPATIALFGVGLAGLGWSRRRKA